MADFRISFVEFSNRITDFLKALWVPLFSIISAIIFVYKFIQLWRGDLRTVTVIVASIVYLIFLLTLVYLVISTDPSRIKPSERIHRYPRRYRRLGKLTIAILITLPIVIGSRVFLFKRQQPEPKVAKVVILVTKFEGKDIRGRDLDSYRVNEQ